MCSLFMSQLSILFDILIVLVSFSGFLLVLELLPLCIWFQDCCADTLNGSSVLFLFVFFFP